MRSRLEITYQGIKYDIDLYEDAGVTLNYSIAEIQDISKKNTGYSKTIRVPGTANNNTVFKSVFEVSVSGSFPFEFPVDAVIYEDSYEIFRGHIYLQKVLLGISQEIVEYEINVLSTVNSLFADMSDKMLYGNADSSFDLDFSSYNHTLNLQNIIGSWAKGGGQKPGYTYPYTYSDNNSNTVGEGYVYPEINYGRGEVNPNYANSVYSYIDGHRPALFYKEIFDKILANCGYTYDSDFLTSDMFSRMVFPSVKPMLVTDAAVATRNALVKNYFYTWNTNSALMCWHNTSSPAAVEAKTVQFTNGYQYSGASPLIQGGLKYYVPNDGRYTFRYSVDARSIIFKMLLAASSGGVATVITQSPSEIAKLYLRLDMDRAGVITTLKTSDSYAQTNTAQTTWTLYPQSSTMANAAQIGTLSGAYIEVTMDCVKGDIMIPFITIQSPHKNLAGNNNYVGSNGKAIGVKVWADIDVNNSIGSGINFEITAVGGTPVQEGDPIDVSQVLDVKMKQSEFVCSVVTTFNLMIEDDKNRERHLVIEPRNYVNTDGTDTGYYSTGVAIDWSSKLDISCEFTIEPASDYLRKNVLYSWLPDNDVYNASYPTWNQSYDGDTPRVYGDRFSKSVVAGSETVKIQPLLAATPQNDYLGNTRGQLIVPMIIDQPKEYKPRILYWAGYQYPTYQLNEGLHVMSKQNTGAHFVGGSTRGYYGYAGHLNDSTGNDTLDLNWAAPNMWYDVPGGVDYRNLYYRFYARMMQEYTDEDSRMVTAWFWLNGRDISNLKFNDYVLVDGVYYRVNKIIDYSPNSVTKVELLKIIRQDNIGQDAPGMGKVIPTYKLPDDGGLSVVELLAIESRVVINNPEIEIESLEHRVTVIGDILDDRLVIDAGSTVINGNVYDSAGRIIPAIHLIDGGFNDAPMEFCEMAWEVMDGGFNAVRSRNGISYINKIDSK